MSRAHEWPEATMSIEKAARVVALAGPRMVLGGLAIQFASTVAERSGLGKLTDVEAGLACAAMAQIAATAKTSESLSAQMADSLEEFARDVIPAVVRELRGEGAVEPLTDEAIERMHDELKGGAK